MIYNYCVGAGLKFNAIQIIIISMFIANNHGHMPLVGYRDEKKIFRLPYISV